MPLPGGLNTVTVTSSITDAAGLPLQGVITLVPVAVLTAGASPVPVVITDAGGNAIVSPQGVTRQVVNGAISSLVVVATDNSGLSPSPWYYQITLNAGTAPPDSFVCSLPHSPATVDFSALVPATTSQGLNAYLPLAGGTETGTVYFTGSPPLQIPSGAASGKVLTSDGSGNASWSSAAGMSNPMTTAGDIIDGGSGGTPQRLAGNTTTTKEFLTSTGTGSAANAPAWGTIAAGDVPVLNQNTTGNAATATAAAGLETATTTVAVSSATAPSNGQVLTATSGTAANWQTPSSGFANPMTTAGDLIDGGTGGAAQRLGIGSTGQVLTVSGGAPAWAALPAATGSAEGVVQLAGDLGNTAASPQVVSTHLSAALPVAQGGTGSTTRNFAGLLTPTAVKTTTYTAAAGDFVPCDTTSGSFTVTLPNAPADLSVVGVKQVTLGTGNSVTIACAGADVLDKTGGSTSTTLVLTGQGKILQYKASGAIWYVFADDLPLTQLDGRYVASVTAADTSVVVGGTASAPTVRTGTLDVIASDHPPAAAVGMNSQKITSLANGSASSDAAAYGQTPAGGNTATIAQGGTGQTAKAAAFNALSPNAALGDITYGSGTNTSTNLAGNTTTTKEFLTSTGTGSAANAPAWGTIASGDLPAATTSAQGAVQLDGTASDLKAPAVTAAAGTSTKAPAADHVHPLNDPLQIGAAVCYFPGPQTQSASVFTANFGCYMKLISGGYAFSNLVVNVTVSSGNISVAAYTNSGTGMSAAPTGGRLATSGAIACPAAGLSTISLGSSVTPNLGDWVAISADNTTATFTRTVGVASVGSLSLPGWGSRQASAHPLPATPSSLAADASIGIYLMRGS